MRLLRRLTRSLSPRPRGRAHGRRRQPHQLRRWELALGGAVGVGALALAGAIFATQLAAPSSAQRLSAYIATHAQKLEVASHAAPAPVVSPAPAASGAAAITSRGAAPGPDLTRDGYGATPGLQTLSASGTNYDWAKIVLLDGGWPQTDANVTVMTRWMRQENGPDDWWNRNNPLNMGNGGFATFPSLLASAQGVAHLIHSNPGMAGIDAALAAGDDTAATESAIWNSNWAGGHYAYGGHWHYTPVERIKAPASAW
jgi:hypothetical protein